MPDHSPRLHILCGKAASGKSTLGQQLASAPLTVLISEDHWLSTLFGDRIQILADYSTYSGILKSAMKPHTISLLQSGMSVVLDFPANTLEQRNWMREILDESGVEHTLHYLDVSDAECKERLKRRNLSGIHPFEVSEELFDRLVEYFVPPHENEGFNICTYKSDL